MRMAVFEHVRERREVHDPEAADNRWLREAFENQIRLHVSDRLLGQNDGPMLEALKRLNGGTIHLPSRLKDRPDRDRLALCFKRFKAVA